MPNPEPTSDDTRFVRETPGESAAAHELARIEAMLANPRGLPASVLVDLTVARDHLRGQLDREAASQAERDRDERHQIEARAWRADVAHGTPARLAREKWSTWSSGQLSQRSVWVPRVAHGTPRASRARSTRRRTRRGCAASHRNGPEPPPSSGEVAQAVDADAVVALAFVFVQVDEWAAS